ncbi:LPXTG cell wall anchor domain-containing protein [Enterococcus hirae]
MKKLIVLSLFSTVLLFGGISSFADETDVVPVTPDISEGTAPTPISPDVGDSTGTEGSGGSTSAETEPSTPITPPVSDTGGEVTPVNPDIKESTGETSSSETQGNITDGGSTEQSTTQSSHLGTVGEKTTDVTPAGSSSASTKEETPKREEEKKQADTQVIKPAKEVTVSVNPQGQITTDTSQGISVPIITSNVGEISHVPTPTTPLKVASGQSIVGVLDGVPLVQNEQGELVKDPSIEVKKLPSGNIEVKTADGQTKVLPKTGEKLQIGLPIFGSIITAISSYLIYLKKQGNKWYSLVKK